MRPDLRPTRIEALMVITLIVLPGSMGIPPDTDTVLRPREAVLKEDLFRMRDAIAQYYADTDRYPQSLADLVTHGYLRRIPNDPMTHSTSTWTTVAASDANNSDAERGVYDVKSGSPGTALDGTLYADWN